jgi:hypothetical protein
MGPNFPEMGWQQFPDNLVVEDKPVLSFGAVVVLAV